MPRWVKGFAIAGVVLLVLIVGMLLAGNGPGRHSQGLGLRGATAPSIVAVDLRW